MDEFIRHLPHDSSQLQSQWPDIFNTLNKLSIDIPKTDQPTFKVKCLDALVDYILADNEEITIIKSTFIETTIKKLTNDPLPSLDEVIPIFCRVLDVPNTTNLLNLTFLQTFYSQYRLGERLSKIPSIDLIDLFLNCLQKHEFSDQDSDKKIQEQWKQFLSRNVFSRLTCDINKINYEQTMTNMRSSFQQLFR